MDPRSRPRRGVLLVVVVGLVMLVLVLEGCGRDGDEPPLAGATSTTPSPASPAPASTPPVSVPTDVYFLVDSRLGFRLARERHGLPATDRAQAAIAAMIRGPQDPDYTSTWDPGTRVRAVRVAAGVIEVDLSREARRTHAGSQAAERMVQQLVWTVTGVLGPRRAVRLLIEGQRAGELWGVLVWDEPVRRAPAEDVRSLVQIDEPREGAVVPWPLDVSGEAAAFEANVPWRVYDETGKVVREGYAMTSEGQRFAPYSFTVSLLPGTYEVEVREDDPSDGAAGPPMTDSKRFTLLGPKR